MRFAPLVLATLCVAVLFVGLDHVGFLDWREARDAEVAREMWRRGGALTPIYGPAALYQKPGLASPPPGLGRRLPAHPPPPPRARRPPVPAVLLLGPPSP